jgi:hypothetical protein
MKQLCIKIASTLDREPLQNICGDTDDLKDKFFQTVSKASQAIGRRGERGWKLGSSGDSSWTHNWCVDLGGEGNAQYPHNSGSQSGRDSPVVHLPAPPFPIDLISNYSHSFVLLTNKLLICCCLRKLSTSHFEGQKHKIGITFTGEFVILWASLSTVCCVVARCTSGTRNINNTKSTNSRSSSSKRNGTSSKWY